MGGGAGAIGRFDKSDGGVQERRDGISGRSMEGEDGVNDELESLSGWMNRQRSPYGQMPRLTYFSQGRVLYFELIGGGFLNKGVIIFGIKME